LSTCTRESKSKIRLGKISPNINSGNSHSPSSIKYNLCTDTNLPIVIHQPLVPSAPVSLIRMHQTPLRLPNKIKHHSVQILRVVVLRIDRHHVTEGSLPLTAQDQAELSRLPISDRRSESQVRTVLGNRDQKGDNTAVYRGQPAHTRCSPRKPRPWKTIKERYRRKDS
jgi:hypothetical protein